jgi:hypothetical protein
MGTSGTALYSDDTACDVRDEFVQLLSRLRDPAQATDSLLRSWKEQIDDMDEGPVFWLALAETQWKYGCLDEAVKNRAIEVIDSGNDLHRWDGADLKRRRAILISLKSKLFSEQPKARVPKLRRVVEVPSTKVLSPDARASATAYSLAASPHAGAPRMQVLVEMLSSGSRGGGGVFLATCDYTEVQLDWIDPETLRVSYPSHSVVVSQSESAFYYGRTIQIVYSARDA